MQHLKLCFEDIMEKRVLYYDEESEPACFDICEYLNIDNLPAIDGQNFYELSTKKFVMKKIAGEHKIFANESIFDSKVLAQFKLNRHNVLFVFEENSLKGVVHLSDYNRDIVLQNIQDDILSFERKLRQLILLNGYKNKDMYLFFGHRMNTKKTEKDRDFWKGKKVNYEKRINEINSLGEFQLFDFTDLTDFAASIYTKGVHEIGKYSIDGIFKSGATILKELRNLAMHGKNPISKNAESRIYSLQNLAVLIDGLEVLRKENANISMKIREHPDFLRSIELDNRSKLNIIHNHHPKALEYFFGG